MHTYSSRPPYGDGAGVCVYFLVYIVLWFVALLSLWTSFSYRWAELLGAFRQPLDHIGSPWVATEVALISLKPYDRFLTKLDSRLRANGSQVRIMR